MLMMPVRAYGNIGKLEIEKAKGIQFDPVIAEYMIKMIEEDKEK